MTAVERFWFRRFGFRGVNAGNSFKARPGPEKWRDIAQKTGNFAIF
jgi:hypothetical protein